MIYPTLRLLQNLLKRQGYNLQNVYLKGQDNVAADALSRHPTALLHDPDAAKHLRTIQMAHIDEAE